MTPDDNLLDRIARLADELGLPNLQSKIGACRTMLRGDDSLDVAVLGRFKSGKSSLLNHIAGRDALPIGVVPLTAVITKLRYGAIERARALFLDGASRAIGLEEIGRYVSEKENPDNVRRVAAVDIELPSLERFAPLQFVDTPGLGSAFAHNTAAALEWLPNVGAAIVTVSVDAPLSERDLALLAELRRHTPAITLLLTKADLLDDAQRIEVRAFVDEQLGRQGGQAPRVHFYSVLPAHAEYKVEFERDVLLPLLRQRGSTLRRILRHKLDSLAAQAIEHARIALVAATQVESARRALAQRLALERRQLKIMRVEMRDLARQWIGGTIDDSLAALLPAQRALEARLAEELASRFAEWRVPLPEFLRRWREWLGAFLLRELSDISSRESALFCAPLEKTRDHLERTLEAFHGRLAGHVQAALGVKLAPREVVLESRAPGAPPVDVGFAFDAAFEMLAPILPLAPLRPLIEHSLFLKSRYEAEKNLFRLAAAWRDSVAAEIDALVERVWDCASDELTALEGSLSQAPTAAPRLAEEIGHLSSCRMDLAGDGDGSRP